MPALPPLRGAFRRDDRARAAYAEAAGIYRIVPAAVAVPADVEDLQALVRWAAETRTPLVPRGAGSAMGGGNVGDGVVVDLTRLAERPLEVDPVARTARVGAAVTLAELNAAAARHGLRLPPDPSSGHWATLGGMVATNAAGARSVRYGSVRRWVRAVDLVLPSGDLATLKRGAPPPSDCPPVRLSAADARIVGARFPRTRKNSSGYALDAFLASGDLLDLVVGAEGTLGIVTGIELALDAVPAARSGLRIALRRLDDLAEAVELLLGLEPSAVELLDRSFLALVASGGRSAALGSLAEAEAVLLVELERDDAAEAAAAADAAASLIGPRVAAVETARSREEGERIWELRHAASPILAGLPEERRSLQVIEDGCVPVPRLGDYIRRVRAAAAARRIDVVMFGHAGDGHLHVNLLPELAPADWSDRVAGLLDDVTDAVVELGGTPSGEHGDGRLRAALLERVYGAEVIELFRRVKQTFDPLGILNPGIILPAGEPPIARLKAGAGATPLPPDIATALREIERRGGYGRYRMEIADGRPGGWTVG